MKRSEGELRRIREKLNRIRNVLSSIELGVGMSGTTTDGTQALMMEAMSLTVAIARYEAFLLVERNGTDVERS